MAFNEEQFVRDLLGATGGKVTVEKGNLNKSFEEMKEDLDKVFKPRESLFTLTAEEVKTISKALKVAAIELDKIEAVLPPSIDIPIYHEKAKIIQLLTRIKQWQDEKDNR